MAKTLKNLAIAFNELNIAKEECLVHDVYRFLKEEFIEYLKNIKASDLDLKEKEEAGDVLKDIQDPPYINTLKETESSVKRWGVDWIRSDVLPHIKSGSQIHKTLKAISNGISKCKFADEEVNEILSVLNDRLDDALEHLDGNRKLQLEDAYKKSKENYKKCKKAYEEYNDSADKVMSELNEELTDGEVKLAFCRSVSKDEEQASKLQQLFKNGIKKRENIDAITKLLKEDELISKFNQLSEFLSK